MTTETKPTSLLLIEGREALAYDYPVALGALAVTGNELTRGVAQRLYDARHVLAALLEVGWRHLDEVHAIVEAKTQPARDDDHDEPERDELAEALREASPGIAGLTGPHGTYGIDGAEG